MRNALGILVSATALLWAFASGCKDAFQAGVDNSPDAALIVPEDTGEPSGSGDAGGAGGAGVIIESLSVDSGSNDGATALVCVGATNADQFKYAPGYLPDPALLKRVSDTLSTMSLTDEATQMRGMPYGSAAAVQMTDVQRSRDTASIRGFRYRDGSRGVNLAEDMDGTIPNAGTVNGTKVGYSTVFPVGVARGAAFDLDLEYAVGEAIGDEMQAAKQTVLVGPCVDVLRHPLWGRAQESYGEDPFHVGRLGSAMVIGVQRHIAASATHFAAYSIENGRAINNSVLDEQTLREMYARHMRMVIRDGGVASVMASYNKVNGIKSTANQHLLTEILRADFGFRGFVMSDFWAMDSGAIVSAVNVLKGNAIAGVRAGLDVEIPWSLNYGQLEGIVNSNGGLTKADIDTSAARILEQKFRFNAQNLSGNVGLGTPVTTYKNGAILNNQSHIDLAQKAALESMVLLKNDSGTLPISKGVRKVAVLGAKVPYSTSNDSQATKSYINFATDVNTGDMGSSRAFFNPGAGIGPYDGIRKAAPSGVAVVTGSDVAVAADADFIVVIAGLTAGDEGEEYTLAGDRMSLALDAKQTDPQYANIQNKLIASAAALGKPMVVGLEGGSAIDMPWLSSVPAVVMAWYPGMVGGAALGHLLWGDVSFSGKLPFSWPRQLSDLPEFSGSYGSTSFDYYAGYRYYDKNHITPLFPYGHGLSYASFEYRRIELPCGSVKKDSAFPVRVTLANTGSIDADETVMVFVSYPNTQARRPAKELKGFARVSLKAGEETTTTVYIRASDLDYWNGDMSGSWVIEADTVQVQVGPNAGNLPLAGAITVVD
jgi:beta-glucosidase